MNDPIRIAAHRFEQGYSCSQAILYAFYRQIGLDEDTSVRLGAPFGGGIARQGETCGAVTGALMVLGLKFGPKPGESNESTYNISQEFLQRFEAEHSSIQCKKLIGYDLSQPDELQSARETRVFHTTCPGLVKSAAEIVNSMINSKSALSYENRG